MGLAFVCLKSLPLYRPSAVQHTSSRTAEARTVYGASATEQVRWFGLSVRIIKRVDTLKCITFCSFNAHSTTLFDYSLRIELPNRASDSLIENL